MVASWRGPVLDGCIPRSFSFEGVLPGKGFSLEGCCPCEVHPRGFQLCGMKLKGCIPEGNILRGPVLKGHISEKVQSVPPALESTAEELEAATSSGPSKDSMQVTSLGAIAGGARRNASGSGLRPWTSSRTTTNLGNGPAPNPSGPLWEAVRRQQSVPGEMSLAPAGGRGGRESSSGPLPAALSDSWPRREDCQGRDFIVDGKEGKKGESHRLAAIVTMRRG